LATGARDALQTPWSARRRERRGKVGDGKAYIEKGFVSLALRGGLPRSVVANR